MSIETKVITIARTTNPENGEVTLFIVNEPWGPIVTGKNLDEAKSKMKKAFNIAMIANSFCHTKHLQENGDQSKDTMSNFKSTLANFDNSLAIA